jgi:thiamine-phosphate diphosphorylase / hydroxyethylthiazole kinase
VLGACLAVDRSSKLLAAVTAYPFSQGLAYLRVLLYSVAAEVAAAKPEVSGPGTFMSAFVDEIHHLSAGDYEWIEKGKLTLWHGDE